MLKAEQTRQIMKEVDIAFVGPKDESRWPQQYADIFREVRDIGRSYFEDLGKEKKRNPNAASSMPVHSLKSRVRKLKKSLVLPGEDPFNERTLRGSIEPHVFSRFAAEVKWYCAKTCCFLEPEELTVFIVILAISIYGSLSSRPFQATLLKQRSLKSGEFRGAFVNALPTNSILMVCKSNLPVKPARKAQIKLLTKA